MKPDKQGNLDGVFSGRGSPALMSAKEPAIQMLKEKYSESFAFTHGSREAQQVHLFLIKLGLWSLVMTLTPRDMQYYDRNSKDIDVYGALRLVEDALAGKNPALAEKLDRSIAQSLERIKSKIEKFKH